MVNRRHFFSTIAGVVAGIKAKVVRAPPSRPQLIFNRPGFELWPTRKIGDTLIIRKPYRFLSSSAPPLDGLDGSYMVPIREFRGLSEEYFKRAALQRLQASLELFGPTTPAPRDPDAWRAALASPGDIPLALAEEDDDDEDDW